MRPVLLGGLDQPFGRGQVRRDRLFDQHVDAALKQRHAHLGVGRGRHRHHRRLHAAGQRTMIRKPFTAVFSGDRARTIKIPVDHGH